MAKSKKRKRSVAAARKLSASLLTPQQPAAAVSSFPSSTPTNPSKAIIFDEFEMLYLKTPAKALKSLLDECQTTTEESEPDEFDTIEYRKMNAEQKRQYRRKTDLRQRNRKMTDAEHAQQLPQKQLCFPHMFGKCTNSGANCMRSHEMRPLRSTTVCYYLKTGQCTKGALCTYMHPYQFPCKHYYLGVKRHDVAVCGWMHGGPLSDEWRDILIDYILKTQQHRAGEGDALFIRQQFDEQHRRLCRTMTGPTSCPNVTTMAAQQQPTTSTAATETNKFVAKRTPINSTVVCDQQHNSPSIQQQQQCKEAVDISSSLAYLDDRTLPESPPFCGFEMNAKN